MPTNALAWGYLGVAFHQAGSVSNAVEAYARALALRPDLAEVRFSLGCLWMERGQWARAREQFAAATVLQPRQAGAWQRLGETQVRSGQSGEALRSLQESVRLDSQDADAWNWLGVAQVQDGRPQDAARSFQAALRLRTNHGAALLNLAILHQTSFKQPQKALDLYGQYLAFLPTSSRARQVREVMVQLQQELNPAPRTAEVARQTESEADRALDVQPGKVVEIPPAPSALMSRAVVRTNRPSRPESASSLAPPPDRTPALRRSDAEPVMETVRVQPVPAIVPATQPSPPSGGPTEEGALVSRDSAEPKRGFFAKINPINLFRKRPDEKQPTPLASESQAGVSTATAPAAVAAAPAKVQARTVPARVEVANAVRFPRYTYQYTASPSAGDGGAAERAFQQGDKLRKRGRQAEAIQAYRGAVEADPSHFGAEFNLGLLSLDAGDLTTALRAFEAATRIEPDSTPARYNFALALKAGGYPVDSANELLILLAGDSDDARAHLTLGNLYAQQFGDAAKAREHYLRVLELEPSHPQAGSIRFWLVQNPS